MDPYKYSTVSHRDFRYCNPISEAKMNRLLDLLDVPADSQALDIATGKAEWLLRLIEQYHVRAIGVDRNPYFLQDAREQAQKRGLDEQLKLLEMDVHVFTAPEQSFQIASCMGASEIFGGFAGTLKALTHWVNPGGYIVVADGYWKREPEEAYLQSFGASRDELMSHTEHIVQATAQGLIPLYATVASEDDWDHYEWLHSRAVELYAQQHPEDPDVPALLQRIRAWREIYVRWGRDTLGFACYLFQKN